MKFSGAWSFALSFARFPVLPFALAIFAAREESIFGLGLFDFDFDAHQSVCSV
jgi:hypothetical protein